MNKLGSILFLFAETHLHPGTGEGRGHIDRSIQRDRATELPIIHASTVKGALRDHLEESPIPSGEQSGEGSTSRVDSSVNPTDVVFGSPKFAGAASPVDARLLLFPVPSLSGVSAWITCPYAIALLARDCKLCRASEVTELPAFGASEIGKEEALVSSHAAPPVVRTSSDTRAVVLDGFTFEARSDERILGLASWLCRYAMPGRGHEYAHTRLFSGDDDPHSSLVLIHDEVFRDFTSHATAVVERNRIGETGTSENLWAEEHLPPGTLLHSPWLFADARTDTVPQGLKGLAAEDLATWTSEALSDAPVLQMGADESLGRGILWCRWLRGENSSEWTHTPADGEDAQRPPAPERELEPVPIPAPSSSESLAPESIYSRRDRELLRFAHDSVRDVVEGTGGASAPGAQEYRSLLRGMPAMLANSGLEGTIAFLLSRGLEDGQPPAESQDADAHWLLYAHIEDWLRPREKRSDTEDPGGNGNESPLWLLHQIRDGSSYRVRIMLREIEELLVWQKRMAEAFIEGRENA